MQTFYKRTSLMASLVSLALLGILRANSADLTTETDPPSGSSASVIMECESESVTGLEIAPAPVLMAKSITSKPYESDYYIRVRVKDFSRSVPTCLGGGRTEVSLQGVAYKFTIPQFGTSYGPVNFTMALPDSLFDGVSGNFGNYDRVVGPNYYLGTYPRLKWECVGGFFLGQALGSTAGPIWEDVGDDNVILATSSIRPPNNLVAEDGIDDDSISISWTKGTDFPNSEHVYRIYRDNILVGTVSGDVRSWTDTDVESGQEYTYSVSSFASGYGAESVRAQDKGRTFSIGLIATDGTKYNATNLKWNDISTASDEIRVERDLPDGSGREELAILSSSARGYNVTDGIPGYRYTFYVRPVGDGFEPDSDTGFSRPDGTLSGHVRSTQGAGVEGVEVTLTLLDTLPSGGKDLPGGCVFTYCTTTDLEGYYEFRDVYYYEAADFRVVPTKDGTVVHEFTPVEVTRGLSVNSKNAKNLDFTDQTVFTAAGRVTFPESPNGAVCGVGGVTILIDSVDYGIRTKSTGRWSYALQEEGNYTFTAQFIHHLIEAPSGNAAYSLFVDGDHLALDFIDRQTDTLTLFVQGSCGEPLGSSATVEVYAPQNCFFEQYDTRPDGSLELILPARDYSVKVTGINGGGANATNILLQIGNFDQTINLTVRDTSEVEVVSDSTVYVEEILQVLPNDSTIVIQAADTIPAGTRDTIRAEVRPELSFIYRSPLDISIDYKLSGVEVFDCDAGPTAVMEQGMGYVLTIDVREALGVDCALDTGYLKIYDFVSDRGNDVVRVPIRNGIATYTVAAGEPIIEESAEHNHEKLLFIVPDVDLVPKEGVEFWFLVTGTRIITPSFITRTPQIPFLILHDPPGDNSYAFVEQGESFSTFSTLEVKTGGGAGIFANLTNGASITTPFGSAKLGIFANIKVEAGRDNLDRRGLTTTLSFTERFATSSLDNLAGNHGDVYIGAALNQEFSDAQHLTFDNCQVDIREVPTISAIDFATTFVFTEQHIKNSLLPTLGRLRRSIIGGRADSQMSEEERYESNHLLRDSLSWVDILSKNDLARSADATLIENVSFSAGAPIYREESFDTVSQFSFEFAEYVNTDFSIGLEVENKFGAWHKSQLGAMGSFRWSSTETRGGENAQSRKVGYVLDDGDIGDFFSVDILRDKSYNVPAFNLKVGSTSCPQEPGSQARDRPKIVIDAPELNDVPADGTANFVCRVSNISESRETREYAVRVVSTTNPDGAIVRLGGQIINNGPAHFFLPYDEVASLNLSVTRGPLASNYGRIGVMVYPPCEYELWQDNGTLLNADTAYFEVNFQTECTNIALRNPGDGWIVNQASANVLHTTLSGYDLNNESFQYATIEVKRDGEGYVPYRRIEKGELELVGPNYDVYLDMSGYANGTYRIRAVANCGKDGLAYSSEKRGIIDRNSLAPFGIPTPNDGFLRLGQEISVTFDKPIDCNFRTGYAPVVRLQRVDTGEEIDLTTSCSGTRLVINTDPHLRPSGRSCRACEYGLKWTASWTIAVTCRNTLRSGSSW